MADPNLPLLEDAVRKLAPFLDEIVFMGGVTLGLRITDEAAAPIRGTTDVDVIAEIVTYADYIAFSDRLRAAHFTEDTDLTCRWHNGTLTLDVLALSKDVLGFTNVWYESALRHSSTVNLSRWKPIRVIAAPFFLGTKMEAFRGRGRMDFQASHDLEILSPSSKGEIPCYKRSPNRHGISKTTLRKQPNRCCRDPGSSMFFLDLSWTARGFP